MYCAKLVGYDAVMTGEEVELEMPIYTGTIPIVAYADVVWCRKMNETSYEMGVQFKDIVYNTKKKIVGYTYHQTAL